jgi:hypothetical protein
MNRYALESRCSDLTAVPETRPFANIARAHWRLFHTEHKCCGQAGVADELLSNDMAWCIDHRRPGQCSGVPNGHRFSLA